MSYLDAITTFVHERLYPLEPILLQHGFDAVAPQLLSLIHI